MRDTLHYRATPTLEPALEPALDVLGKIFTNEEVVRIILTMDVDVLTALVKTFPDVRSIALRVVKRNGDVLQHVSEQFKNDVEVVHEAVKNKPGALQYAPAEVKSLLFEKRLARVLRTLSDTEYDSFVQNHDSFVQNHDLKQFDDDLAIQFQYLPKDWNELRRMISNSSGERQLMTTLRALPEADYKELQTKVTMQHLNKSNGRKVNLIQLETVTKDLLEKLNSTDLETLNSIFNEIKQERVRASLLKR